MVETRMHGKQKNLLGSGNPACAASAGRGFACQGIRMSGIRELDESTLAAPVGPIAARYGNRHDALIEMLHTMQGQVGTVPAASAPPRANGHNLSHGRGQVGHG